jgi:nucleoid-associated protein YgaU
MDSGTRAERYRRDNVRRVFNRAALRARSLEGATMTRRSRHFWLVPIALLFVVASSCHNRAHATNARDERTNATNAERRASGAAYRASGLAAYRDAARARRAARDANRKTRIGEPSTKGDSEAPYKREFRP